MLLLFLLAEDAQHWWQIDASGRIIARGDGTLPAESGPIIAVPPADAVALHRISLPALAPAQAQAAARHLAAERSAAPIDSLHTAISAANAEGQCWLAVASLAEMTSWKARLASQGISAPIVPLPLLLPAPALLALGGLHVVHTDTQAFAAEPDLAAALIDPVPPGIDDAVLARRLPVSPPLDLRQGRFGPTASFLPSRRQLRQLALLAASAAALWVAGDIAAWWQVQRAASTQEAARDQLAAALLPPGTPLANARAQVQARVARSQSGVASRLAAPLLDSLAERPDVSLAALTLESGTMVATLDAASPGYIAAIETTLRARGLSASAGLPRTVAGRSQVDLTVHQP